MKKKIMEDGEGLSVTTSAIEPETPRIKRKPKKPQDRKVPSGFKDYYFKHKEQ